MLRAPLRAASVLTRVLPCTCAAHSVSSAPAGPRAAVRRRCSGAGGAGAGGGGLDLVDRSRLSPAHVFPETDLVVFPSFIDAAEAATVHKAIEKALKRRRYEKDHWDSVCARDRAWSPARPFALPSQQIVYEQFAEPAVFLGGGAGCGGVCGC